MTKQPRIDRTRPARRKSVKTAVSRRSAAKGKPIEEARYHHGGLHEALLEAAEKVLERDGLPGLTLRAVAREAGVAHAAPTHHFGDLTRPVREHGPLRFRQFNAAMAAADSGGPSPLDKAMARAKAYVAYARGHPGMYGL